MVDGDPDARRVTISAVGPTWARRWADLCRRDVGTGGHREMLILGIETATEQVSVALAGHEGVIALFEVARGRRHAETLTPAIEFVCAQADIGLDEIGLVAVDVGPGLFTGMRVGLATGKALALALRLPMIGISSLDLLAFPHRRSDRVVVPVIDARKGEVFYAMYRQVPGGLQQVVAPRVGPVDELVADLLARSQEALCVGDGALRYRAEIRRRLPLRDRRRRPPVGRAARAARPCPGAPRGVGQPGADPPDLPAPARCPDQLGDPGVPRRGECIMSVLARLLERPASPPTIEPMRHRHDLPGARHRASCASEAVERDGVPRRARPGGGGPPPRTSSPAQGRSIVGYGGLMFVADEAHVTNLVVHPEHRRTGIGHPAAR